MKLVVKDVNKAYGKTKAVSNFSTEFTSGIYGLLGANGAGKTTLIKLLSGVLLKDSGQIELDNKKIENYDLLYKSNLGYLPQEFLGYPEFTAEEFLQYIALIKGVAPKEIVNRTEEMLKKVDLYEVKKKKIKTYSGGMKRRLGIAQAMINYPKILILDEPTAGLDPKERVFFRNTISDYGKNNIIILSTHIVSDIEYIAKEIMVIKDGVLINKGNTEKLVNSIDGKVWECKLTKELEQRLQHEIIVNTINKENGEVVVRFVAQHQIGQDVLKVKPKLEDLYLYYFGDDKTWKNDVILQ